MKKTLLFLLLLPFLGFSQTDFVSWSPNPNSNLNPTILNNQNLSAFPITASGFTPSTVWTGVQGTGFPTGNSIDLTKYFQYSVSAYFNNTVTIKEIKFSYRGTAKRHEVRYSKNADFSNPVTLATAFNNDAAEWAVKSGNITLSGGNIITLNPGERIYIRIYAAEGSQRVITDSLILNGTTTVPSPLSGTFSVGAAQAAPFNTLTNAVNAVNSFGISGPVTLLLTDATYSNATGETFPITLNTITGSSSTNTITIKPASGVNVSVDASNVNSYTAVPAVIKLNGADNVVIDGSNSTDGTTRNLTLHNKGSIDYTARTVVWVAAVGSNGATNITIKNTNIRQAFKNAAGTFCVGVYSGANNTGDNNAMAVAVAAGDNANLKIVNNDFMNVKQGVYINGSASVPTTNVVVHQNDLGAENNTETIIQPACFSNVNGFEYTENLIYNLYRNSTAGNLTSAGIFITGNTRNGYILKNIMRKLTKTHTDEYTFAGITLASSNTNSNIVVANNFISNVAANGNSDSSLNGHGINIASGGGYKIYHNTVRLEDNQATAGYSSALYIHQGITGLDIRNNIFVNMQTAGLRRTAIMVKDAKANANAIFTHLNYNNYYSLDQLGFIADANSVSQINWPQNPDYVDTLNEWKTATGKDANSVNVNAEFTSSTNLHLTANNFSLDNLGTPLAAVTKDIDGQMRSTTTPDMGADEFGAIQLVGGGANAGIYCSSSTTWNGTAWSNGNPAANKDVIFTGNFTQNGGTLYACSIFVQGTAQVLFSGNSNAVVTHNVNVDATANVTFESGSNLIQIENTQNVGNVTVKRFGSRLKKLDYTFWSSPVTGTQTLQEFSPATLSNRFYTYNTATSTYLSVASPSTTAFTTARGYLIRMPNSITGPQATAYNAGGYRFAFEGIFTGVPNNGNIYIPLTYVETTGSYNSVGNPYPSPISVTDFIDANIDNIEGTIWVWRKDNNPNTTSYGTITKMGYTANAAPGGNGSSTNNPNAGVNDLIADPFSIHAEGILNTGQGFIVKAKTNQDLVFRNNMRLSNNYNNFFRSAETADTEPTNALVASRLWLNVTNAAQDVFSQILVGYTSQATMGYDNGIDGKGFVDGTVALYTVIEDYKLAIQGRPSFVDTDIVPLGFKTETAGEFIIHLDHVNGLFEGEQDIYIKDNVTGVVHDIKEGDYTFTTEVGTFEDRFEVIYLKENSELGNDNTGLIAQEVKVYRNGSHIKIDAPEEIQAVTVFDVQGKTIYQNNAVGSLNFTSTAITATQQMLIVNIQFANGQLVSKKIMMN